MLGSEKTSDRLKIKNRRANYLQGEASLAQNSCITPHTLFHDIPYNLRASQQLFLDDAESVEFLGSKFANVQASVILRIIEFLFGHRRKKDYMTSRHEMRQIKNKKANIGVERGMMGSLTSPHHLSLGRRNLFAHRNHSVSRIQEANSRSGQ